MKKLSQTTTDLIYSIVNTANKCSVDAVVIAKELIRGQPLDQGLGIFILNNQPFPALEFDSLGIGRVNVLLTRMNLLDGNNIEIYYDSKIKDNGEEIVTKLYLKNRTTSMEYNCMDSSYIKSPKKIHDPMFHSFTINDDTLKLMSKSLAALNLKHVSFMSESDGTVHFRASDTEGDKLDHLVSDSYTTTQEATNNSFFYKYSIKLLLPLLRAASLQNKSAVVNISSRSFLRTKIDGLNVYILGEV